LSTKFGGGTNDLMEKDKSSVQGETIGKGEEKKKGKDHLGGEKSNAVTRRSVPKKCGES